LFQSTPHLSGKANPGDLVGQSTIIKVSIHASPQRQGEQHIFLLPKGSKRVSIHASPQRQGERQQDFIEPLCEEFQSTPHLSGKANSFCGRGLTIKLAFQSTPHLSGKANLFGAMDCASYTGFQSTPHLSGKANSKKSPVALKVRFNPRLTSAARRTPSLNYGARGQKSFNPRLTSAARRTP